MRSPVSLISAVLGLALTVASVYAYQQDQTPQGNDSFRVHLEFFPSWSLWNDSRNELITSPGYIRPVGPSARLALIYDVVSGAERSIGIPEDFSAAQFINVDAIAVGPDGSVLIACDAKLGDGPFAGDRLLLYDNHSSLTMNLPTADYDVGAVALDKLGNAYVVGDHDDEVSSEDSYPLLVKYDSYGHITLEALSSSLFSTVDEPIGDAIGDTHSGATRITVNEKAIEVYLAPVNELIVLNQSGEIQSRVNVASRLREFAKTNGYNTLYVDADEFSPSGDLWLAGRLTDAENDPTAPRSFHYFVVRLTPEGELQVPFNKVEEGPSCPCLPQLIGFTQSNEPVAFSPRGSGYSIVRKGSY
jgi:hypothetical protein